MSKNMKKVLIEVEGPGSEGSLCVEVSDLVFEILKSIARDFNNENCLHSQPMITVGEVDAN